LRVQGRILKAGQFAIDIEASAILAMSEVETSGTRIRFLLPDIRREFGTDASKSVSDKAIEDCIKAQILMGRPAGHTLVDHKKIMPQISSGSQNYKLLVLYTTLQLIQSTKVFSSQQRQDRSFKIENEIHQLEDGGAFSAFSQPG